MRGLGGRRAAALGLALGLAVAAGALPATRAAASSPRIDYMLHCQGCHLPGGSGKPGSVPSLRDSIGLFTTVSGGRAFLVRVPGSASSPLSDRALADVLSWMIREFGPAEVARNFDDYDAEEVAKYRDSPLVDVETVRGDLLRRIRMSAEGQGDGSARRPESPD